MVVFTSIQIDKENLSSKIYSNVGLPTVKNFNHMVSTNMISNWPIPVADIRNDEKIYGPSMESLKGKPRRSKPRLAIKDYIKIPSKI